MKFTNVMKGFQYRWVVVDSINGVLEYYEVSPTLSLFFAKVILLESKCIPSLLREKNTKSLKSLEGPSAL